MTHFDLPQLGRPGPALAIIAVAMVLGVGLDRLLISSSNILTSARGNETDGVVPQLVKQGRRIVIPQGSSLRTRLLVADAVTKEIARSLVLPAVVEADPARTVKVLPPVTGRVTGLKVQLGERVTKGQELA